MPKVPSGDEATARARSDAREILDALDTDSSRLATRIVTPWWYHVALGAIVALFVVSQTLPAPLAISLVVVGILALPVLSTAYERRYGVSVSQPAGRGSRRLLLAAVGVLAASMALGLAITFAGLSAWWGLLPAAAAFAATVALGRRYDRELRAEVSNRGENV